MTPQLWTQFLTFQEWKVTHLNLTEDEAILLYQAEMQLYQNYQDEIRNQTLNRRAQLTGDLLNLSVDISTTLIEGGRYWLAGYYDGIVRVTNEAGESSHQGSFLGSDTHEFQKGDIFLVSSSELDDLSLNGFYRVIISITLNQGNFGISQNIFQNRIRSGHFLKIANEDSTPV